MADFVRLAQRQVQSILSFPVCAWHIVAKGCSPCTDLARVNRAALKRTAL